MLFLKVILIILYLIIGACIYSVARKESPGVQDFVLLIWILWPVFFIAELIREIFMFLKGIFKRE